MTKLEQYLLNHLSETDESIVQLETYAKLERVPIMDPVSMNFLMQMIRLKKPKHILEIGTAIGYSALRMSEAYPAAKIVTIERNEQFYHEAIKNIKQFNKEETINVIYGDALKKLTHIANSEQKPLFDFVFIDAAKAQYKRFFKLVQPLLAEDGVVISDNILFRGLVVDNKTSEKRLSKLAEKINKYNKWLIQLEGFSTSIVPIGDGIAITVRI